MDNSRNVIGLILSKRYYLTKIRIITVLTNKL